MLSNSSPDGGLTCLPIVQKSPARIGLWLERNIPETKLTGGECDETRALFGQIEPSRLEDAGAEEKRRERKPGLDLVHAWRFQSRFPTQEGRQGQELVLVGLAGFGANRATAFRRDID